MKYCILFLLLGSMLQLSAHPGDSLLISGIIRGQGSEKLTLSFTDEAGKQHYYSTVASKDRFQLKVKKQEQPAFARFNSILNQGLTKTVNGQNFRNPAAQLELFIEQSDIAINGTIEALHLATLKGGKANNDFAAYRKSVIKLEQRKDEIDKRLFYDSSNDKATRDQVLAEGRGYFKKQHEIQKKFISEHPDAFGSLFLLSRMENMYTVADYEAAFNNLGNGYKQTAMAQRIAKRIEFLSPTAKGKSAVPFIKKDKDGKEINLAAYKGKIVLLDFWGSWCGPCRASHPHLKELYAKYKDKGFEIIAIASETAKTPEEQKDNWLAAIAKDDINWVHILNNETKQQQDLVKDYRVTAYPTKILIDQEGKILLRISASATDDIDLLLEKIFHK